MTEKTTSRSSQYLFDAFHAKCGDALAKLVLLNLANRANNDGECYPSIERIAEDCETSKSTVLRKLEKLEAMGHIRRIRRAKDGMKTSNLYQLPLVTQGFSVVSERHIEVSERHQGSVTVTPSVVSERHIKHAVETPKETRTPPESDSVLEQFELFWSKYPRKEGKKKAIDLFRRLNVANRTACLADDVKRRFADRERKYIPAGDQYIKRQLWHDDLPDAKGGSREVWL